MPSKPQHIAKADGNVAFALSLELNSQPRIDWALVALFYAAVHYIEAYLATRNQHLRSHTTRDSMVGRESNLRKIFAEYQDLKFYWFTARYEMYNFRATDVTERALKHIEKIKEHLKAFL